MVTYLFAWMSVFIHQTCGFCFSYDFQACVNKSISELRAYHNLIEYIPEFRFLLR